MYHPVIILPSCWVTTNLYLPLAMCDNLQCCEYIVQLEKKVNFLIPLKCRTQVKSRLSGGHWIKIQQF